jgi:hypothetical protein
VDAEVSGGDGGRMVRTPKVLRGLISEYSRQRNEPRNSSSEAVCEFWHGTSSEGGGNSQPPLVTWLARAGMITPLNPGTRPAGGPALSRQEIRA